MPPRAPALEKAEVTLQDAIENIESTVATNRKQGLSDLKYIFRLNSRDSRIDSLQDGTYLWIYDRLFQVALDEQAKLRKANTTITRSTVNARLSEAGSALRLAVETGIQRVKLKTIRAVIGHVIETIFSDTARKEFCEPLALDYVRTLRVILSYQPHVEHLTKEWDRVVKFCVECIDLACDGVAATNGYDAGSAAGLVNGSSYRSSSRSVRESGGSQGLRSITRMVAEEAVLCLQLATAAPNAPLRKQSDTLLSALIKHLRTSTTTSKAYADAFKAINSLLSWTRVEDVKLTQDLLVELMLLVRQFWLAAAGPAHSKSHAITQMLVTLLHLEPYIMRGMLQQHSAIELKAELRSLTETIRAEYSGRLERDTKKLLNTDDFRLQFTDSQCESDGAIFTPLFRLRCTGERVECNWLLVYLLASFCCILSKCDDPDVDSDDEHARAAHNEHNERPRKRQRRQNYLDSLVEATYRGTTQSRTCGLQVLAFMVQQQLLTVQQLQGVVCGVIPSCTEDSGNVASWAFLVLAACASQVISNDQALCEQWSATWQISQRSLSNVSTCRSAAFVLAVMLQRRLVSQANIQDLVQMASETIELNGPAELSDAVSLLLSIVLKTCQHLNPAASSAAADTIMSWVSTTFTPAKFDDKQVAAAANHWEAADLVSLAAVCLNQQTHVLRPFGLQVWDVAGRAWLSCNRNRDLVAYLLLTPPEENVTHRCLLGRMSSGSMIRTSARSSSETIILTHLTAELMRANSKWTALMSERGASRPNTDSVSLLCKTTVVALCVASCCFHKDSHRKAELEKQTDLMLASVTNYTAHASCDRVKTDVLLSAFSATFSAIDSLSGIDECELTCCEKTLCRHLAIMPPQQQYATQFDNDDDDMDLDDTNGSQDSRHERKVSDEVDLANDLDVAYSRISLRSSVALYAAAVSMKYKEDSHADNSSVSAEVTDFLLAQSATSVLSGRKVITTLPRLGIVLSPTDTERLLDYFMVSLIGQYSHKRSEVSLGTVLDVMSSLSSVWTNRNNKSLYDLGLDIYEWFMGTALPGGFLSPNVLMRLATLLLQLCHVDSNYAGSSDAGSVRTSLFGLLRKGRVPVQYHLAGRIAAVFGRFVLSTHEKMFVDLQESLPDSSDWLEGLAMRLLFLSKLGVTWHTLRRQCIYGIFETAGHVQQAASHAARCLEDLASCLKLETPRRLFAMFAPQLFFTWLSSNQPLSSLPYAAFGYASLHDLLATNQAESCAQLLLKSSEAGLNEVGRSLKLSPTDAVKQNFAKCAAYALSSDVKMPAAEASKAIHEKRIKNLLGSDTYKTLITERFPSIMGYFFLCMHQDDAEDAWLSKHPKYTAAAEAMTEMKHYSHSSRILPSPQQPTFKSKILVDQLERLCRRVGSDAAAIWTPSSLTLVIRMLLDSLDDSLGSLHSCTVIRRLRVLISLAGAVACEGLALETLLHSLRPFISDSECADDTIGILQYLLQHARDYLRSNQSLLIGTVTLLVLQMSKHGRTKQDSTTQESQHSATVQKMQTFQKWLVDLLRDISDESGSASQISFRNALQHVQLPGNAREGSPESTVLLYVLQAWTQDSSRLSTTDAAETLRLLAEDFEAPTSVIEDCLGNHSIAASYAQQLWESLQAVTTNESYRVWAAAALGRTYASTGVRPVACNQKNILIRKRMPPDSRHLIAFSQATIVEYLCDTLFSKNRVEAGLADFTLRMQYQFEADDAEEASAFDQMLPVAVFTALSAGNYGYEPPSSTYISTAKIDSKALRIALNHQKRQPHTEEWFIELATALCRWTDAHPAIASLIHIVHNVPGLAHALLPSMIHILLVKDFEKQELRGVLSDVIRDCLSQIVDEHHAKQRFFLQLLLYLKSQTFPNEATKVERLQWLDLDWTIAARAGSNCGMPTSALLIAEFAAPAVEVNRRTSSRMSVSQPQQSLVPEDLLLSIYEQVEEPDSFYGVQQEASLENVLNRLDHEADGFRSLMFRSAQMESHMRSTHRVTGSDAAGMARALSALNFNGLAFALLRNGFSSSATSSDDLMAAARSLQQWDITPPESTESNSTITFKVLQELSRVTEASQIQSTLSTAFTTHAERGIGGTLSRLQSQSWFSTLAILSETSDLLASANHSQLVTRWQTMLSYQNWMHVARFDDVKAILTNRQTLFGLLSQSPAMRRILHLDQKQSHRFEVEALLEVSKFGRAYSRLQESLSATSTLSEMAEQYGVVKLNVQAAIKSETASVLWDAGEASASIKMLRDTLGVCDLEKQDIDVGRAGLMAQLGHQLAEARLEKPEDILSNHLKPAIAQLKSRKEGREAGKVFFEFASFCDQEYQNPVNRENFNRIVKLRQGKQEEIEAIKTAIKNVKKTGDDKTELLKSVKVAQQWHDIDSLEEQRQRDVRNKYIQQSLQNYLLALHAADEHDICVLRFFALWLENADDLEANAIVLKYLPHVPGWKLILLMNQLMSRVEDEPSIFQKALQQLLMRMFAEHPYHSLHHLFAAWAQKPSSTDSVMQSRNRAATSMYNNLRMNVASRTMVDGIFRANRYFKQLTEVRLEKGQTKFKVDKVPLAQKVVQTIPQTHTPPVTMTLTLKPSCDYSDAPKVTGFEPYGTMLGGLSAPKMLTVIVSDGKSYKEIYKSGNDDLRQDAIMEQVFEEVSKMLRNHKATRQRDLKVRTYKVVPLTTRCGVIEFVANSMPINDFLGPAHKKYYPSDWPQSKVRDIIGTAAQNGAGSTETRVKEFRKVCEHMHPVMRHFFFQNFDDPDEWFEKRTAYTRTTASISILGYILGLGDRHCSNILLDKQTGECVHIDLGVAFEAGRVLPIPEMVPFRLTRDIVDGMGVTGVEGVFRRCCEFTLDAVREDKDSIMTLLNVLRYDPLYSWSLSPLRAKRMQEAQETARKGLEQESSTKKGGSEAGEADRALSIVEKKLAKTLSTPAAVNELIQQATDERNLATLFVGWAAYF